MGGFAYIKMNGANVTLNSYGDTLLNDTMPYVTIYALYTELECRNKKAATRILRVCKKYAEKHNVALLFWCRDELIPWYTRIGLITVDIGDYKFYVPKRLQKG